MMWVEGEKGPAFGVVWMVAVCARLVERLRVIPASRDAQRGGGRRRDEGGAVAAGRGSCLRSWPAGACLLLADRPCILGL